jgi:long-chain acyl-CoA synthetase
MTNSDNRNIYSVFTDIAARRGKHPAVIYLGNRFSYKRMHELSARFAAALNGLGIEPGQKVMLYIPNGIQWVVCWLGIQKLGAVAVPITPIYTPHDITYIANDSEAVAIVCADTNFGYVTSVLSETPLKKVIVSKMGDLLPWWKRSFGYLFDVIPRGKITLNENTYAFNKLLSGSAKSALPPTDSNRGGNDVAEILYTGGTTKFPKGVPLSHNLFLVSAMEQITMSNPIFTPEENVVMGNAPLFHVLGQTCSLATIFAGGSLILQPRINMDASFDAIQRYGAKTMIGVPALYRMILEHDRLDQYDLSSLVYCFSGGDVLPVEVGKRWKDRFGHSIFQGYGATETCGGVSMCPVKKDNPPKSVGQILPSKKIKIVDPKSLEPVEPGKPGELLVSSRHMVNTYLNKPEETREAFVELDGETWYRTADISNWMAKHGIARLISCPWMKTATCFSWIAPWTPSSTKGTGYPLRKLNPCSRNIRP